MKRCLVQIGNAFQYITETISDPVKQVIQTDHKSGLRAKGKQTKNVPACLCFTTHLQAALCG